MLLPETVTCCCLRLLPETYMLSGMVTCYLELLHVVRNGHMLLSGMLLVVWNI